MHFPSGEEILQIKDQMGFDIVFLDIKLDGIDGIETAQRLRALGYENAIVFTSNHREYEFVQKGFDVRALNYFAKPITTENIEACMRLLNIGKSHKYLFNGRLSSIPYHEITYFECSRNYIIIHTHRKEPKLPRYKYSMANLAAELPESFVQIHRSYIVNITHIAKIEGRMLYVNSDGKVQKLPISESHLPKVISTMRYL